MGMVIILILIGLFYIGVFLAHQVNIKIKKPVDLTNDLKLYIANLCLRFLFVAPFAILTLYTLESNLPSGANGFGKDKSPWLFSLAPILLGFTYAISKKLSHLILSKVRQ